ncbi:hypothetical protein CEN50_18570 [Fischerella thermalis CCMEE 5268]|uniref:Uncharacterized protein n=1 Tax=Fischerella thermalis CCMEE 5268 TaxID=2019662 RepID=A0A2N6KCP7_9CYAN|nr:hypothetical protein [Fischerella thermalis]PLZ96496.1 hypothetical protein CEN50_18570 [Fischerella thermalis CCMEE 5268]
MKRECSGFEPQILRLIFILPDSFVSQQASSLTFLKSRGAIVRDRTPKTQNILIIVQTRFIASLTDLH